MWSNIYPFYVIFLLLVHTVCADEPINPSLRPHFTVAFRSPATFRPIARIPPGSPIRKAVWDYPLAQLVARLEPSLPENVAFSRTYLRCRLLGWQYGGHVVDVLTVDAVDYERMLLSRGILLSPVADRNIFETVDNQFVLMDKANSKIASLEVPGGFEGNYLQIEQALHKAMLERSFDRDETDWIISFRPSELLDRPLWDAIPIGLAATMQSRDSDSRADSAARNEVGSLLIKLVGILASDVESCELAARFNEDNESATIRFSVAARPNSGLMTYYQLLARESVSRPLSYADMAPALLGIIGLPANTQVLEICRRMKSHSPSLIGSFEDEQTSPILFGICNSRSSAIRSEVFLALIESADRHTELPGSLVNTTLVGSFDQPFQYRLLAASLSDFPATTTFLSKIQSVEETLPTLMQEEQKGSFMFASCSISQFVSLLYPELSGTFGATTRDEDVVWIEGDIHRNSAVITATFPPHSEQYVYLLFEQALHSLKKLSENLPFETISP